MVGKDKGDEMTPVYDPKVKGWRIVYTPNQFINRELWGKPVNNKIYESWDSACHDLDKWAE
jgi:hypothetical protein